MHLASPTPVPVESAAIRHKRVIDNIRTAVKIGPVPITGHVDSGGVPHVSHEKVARTYGTSVPMTPEELAEEALRKDRDARAAKAKAAAAAAAAQASGASRRSGRSGGRRQVSSRAAAQQQQMHQKQQQQQQQHQQQQQRQHDQQQQAVAQQRCMPFLFLFLSSFSTRRFLLSFLPSILLSG